MKDDMDKTKYKSMRRVFCQPKFLYKKLNFALDKRKLEMIK